ncbi:Kinase, NEK [Spironucleus salmonicida]|uniref:non-specific serine/threonine protein kinase n=1 Tax=Spironucleus salmonicida TaxID=348837 RepID=V6LI01_9EUKA|nr:Kinase, NEK [Spironucleus salmonicida]|eukprot:EST43948.1 Kinase, NEK [Spironucleus salmonicida]
MQIRFNSLKITSLADFREIRSYNLTNFGKVSFSLHIPTRAFVVLKYRITSELNKSESSQEAKIYLQLGPHGHIAVFYGFKYLEKRSIIALRYYPLGDLKNQIQRYRKHNFKFQTHHAWYLLYHISKALDHIHKKGFIFCDIKPGNIVLEEDIYTETKAADINFIDEDDISRSCNINFILTDFGHCQLSQTPFLEQNPVNQNVSSYSFDSQNDKINNVFAAKKIEKSFNENRPDKDRIKSGQIYTVSRSPKRQFTTLEVTNFELTKCGTPAYMSNEQVKGKFNEKTDVYSLALVVIEMLFLKKYSEVRDFEFASIEMNLRVFLMKMLQDQWQRPTAADVVSRSFSSLHQLNCLNGGAIKNSSELLQDRMLEMQDQTQESIMITKISNRPSSSRAYSNTEYSQRSGRNSRSASQFSDTLYDIGEEQTRVVDVIGKQSIPSPIREELIQSQRFKQKHSKNIWDWDVEKQNVIDPKENYVENSILQDFGLQAQIKRNNEAQDRYARMRNQKKSVSPHRKYVETGGGGYTLQSTFRSIPRPGYKSNIPAFKSVFGKQ